MKAPTFIVILIVRSITKLGKNKIHGNGLTSSNFPEAFPFSSETSASSEHKSYDCSHDIYGSYLQRRSPDQVDSIPRTSPRSIESCPRVSALSDPMSFAPRSIAAISVPARRDRFSASPWLSNERLLNTFVRSIGCSSAYISADIVLEYSLWLTNPRIPWPFLCPKLNHSIWKKY